VNKPKVNIPVAWALMGITLFVAAWAELGPLMPQGLLYNKTPSLSTGFYWYKKDPGPFERNEIACFRQQQKPSWVKERKYFPEDMLFCKYVLGLPGDTIETREDRHVYICHDGRCSDAGKILDKDSWGRPSFGADLPKTIPAGYYYMGSVRVPNSLDSRYLGLIKAEELDRTASALLIF
jgi:type IV secretory pathway protease TraF